MIGVYWHKWIHTFSICAIVMPIATETKSLFAAIDLISCRTVGTTPGLTDTKTTSAPSTTGSLLVIAFTPNDCSSFGDEQSERKGKQRI